MRRLKKTNQKTTDTDHGTHADAVMRAHRKVLRVST